MLTKFEVELLKVPFMVTLRPIGLQGGLQEIVPITNDSAKVTIIESTSIVGVKFRVKVVGVPRVFGLKVPEIEEALILEAIVLVTTTSA